jgi:hypothetical protein
MTRAQAFEAAVSLIARHVPDIGELISLLDTAGLTRLAAALRDSVPAGHRSRAEDRC